MLEDFRLELRAKLFKSWAASRAEALGFQGLGFLVGDRFAQQTSGLQCKRSWHSMSGGGSAHSSVKDMN